MVRTAKLVVLCSALLGVAVAACSGSGADDVTESSNAALSEYGGVIENGTKIVNDPTITPTQSAKTRVVGFLPKTTVSLAAAQLLKVDKWTGMKDATGKQIFPAARVTSDTTRSGVRTMAADVTLSGDISLSLGLTSTPDSDTGRDLVHSTNTTGYSQFFFEILKPGKLVLDVLLVPMSGGVIVDATMRVKLETAEDQAAGITATLPTMFDWLSATVPHVSPSADAGHD